MPQWPEELAHLVGERLRLLQRGEMAAARHYRPTPDVAVCPFCQRAGRPQDLTRELGISRGYIDGSPLGNRPGPVHARVVRPERGADRAGEPVEADIGEQPITSDHALDIAAAVGPGAELLDDPRGEARRRIGQRESQGLRPCPLDPLIPGLLFEPCGKLAEIVFLLGTGVGRRLLIAAYRQKVDVKADQLLGMGIAEPRGCNAAQSPPWTANRL
jgi:hypothetical protein